VQFSFSNKHRRFGLSIEHAVLLLWTSQGNPGLPGGPTPGSSLIYHNLRTQ